MIHALLLRSLNLRQRRFECFQHAHNGMNQFDITGLNNPGAIFLNETKSGFPGNRPDYREAVIYGSRLHYGKEFGEFLPLSICDGGCQFFNGHK